MSSILIMSVAPMSAGHPPPPPQQALLYLILTELQKGAWVKTGNQPYL